MHSFAILTAVATFILLIAGGLVTSTDSGLAVPDWPLSYGTVFPPMVGGIVYEHTHRVIAATVGLLIAVLAVWAHRSGAPRAVRRLSLVAAAGVVLQGVLGGLTVLLVLPPPMSITHACLGQLVWCAVLALALWTSPSWPARQAVDSPGLRGQLIILTAACFGQLVLGAVIRHSGRALMWHMTGALLLPALAGALWHRLRRQPRRHPLLLRCCAGLLIGLIVQILLGVLTVIQGQPVLVTTAHVVLGAGLLGLSWTMTLLAWPAQASQPAVWPAVRPAAVPAP